MNALPGSSAIVGAVVRLSLVLAVAVQAWHVGAWAQDAQRIAAVVNDEIISTFDLAARVELVVRTTGLPDNPETRDRIRPQVLRTLIDERLELQEAARLGIEISESDVEGALRFLERQNRIPEGTMLEALAARGVAPETLTAQVEAQLKWSRIVQARLRLTLTIADAEVDELIARLEASRGKPEFRLAEIYLAADDPAREAEVVAVARRLMEDIQGGADFGALARQVSQAASAASGGDLGWTVEDQLADEVR
ncbi:MAG: SurA N-terminal domain-containing protein, partial [Alphaproteobacteria bacterium]